MSREHDDRILVKVTVAVPTEKRSALRLRQRMLNDGSIAITIPSSGSGSGSGGSMRVAQVRQASGAAGTGTICAEGTALHDGVNALHIIARVYPNVVTAASIQDVPDLTDPGYVANPGAPGVVPSSLVRVVAPSGSSWSFTGPAELPGAQCGSSSGSGGGLPTNTLVVWAYFPGLGYANLPVCFQGQCSTQTDCDQRLQLALPGHAALPHILTGTVLERSGAFAAWPERLEFLKMPGKQEWVYRDPRRPEFRCSLVYEDEGAIPTVHLLSNCFEPARLVPHQSHWYPVEVVFRATGRSDLPNCQGHVLLIITQ